MSGGNEVLLRTDGLSKSFGGLKAVSGLSFGIRKGSVTSLVGPNGAGKTTVFNLITGTLKPGQRIIEEADRRAIAQSAHEGYHGPLQGRCFAHRESLREGERTRP